MLQAKVVGIESLERDAVPDVEELHVGHAEHEAKSVQAAVAHDGVARGQPPGCRGTDGKYTRNLLTPKLGIVARAHGEVTHVQSIRAVRQDPVVDGQQIPTALVAIEQNPTRPLTMQQQSHQYGDEYVP